jgi:hypothetical protein
MIRLSFYGRCFRTLGVVLFITPWIAGCVQAPVLSYEPTEPPIASLPLTAVGVVDGRNHFSLNFAKELAALEHVGASDVERWIHWSRTPASTSQSTSSLHGVSVLVVSGIFGDCVSDQSLPFSDGVARTTATNLTEGYAYLATSGLRRVRAINVRGRASSMTNGEVIAETIYQEAKDPSVSRIILVGYSKGAPDTLHALELLRSIGLPQLPISFVSLSGVVMGTPIADTHEELYNKLATNFNELECTASDGQEITSLTRRERIRWLTNHPPSPEFNLYSVVAHTSSNNISPGLRPFYRRLAKLDLRNDGQVLASDAVLPGSTLLAEVNSDHWTYVLPLRGHPSWLVSTAAAELHYPRAEFFRALIHTIVELDTLKEEKK